MHIFSPTLTNWSFRHILKCRHELARQYCFDISSVFQTSKSIDTKLLPIRTQNRKAALRNCQDQSMVTKENHLSLGFEKTIGNKEAWVQVEKVAHKLSAIVLSIREWMGTSGQGVGLRCSNISTGTMPVNQSRGFIQ